MPSDADGARGYGAMLEEVVGAVGLLELGVGATAEVR